MQEQDHRKERRAHAVSSLPGEETTGEGGENSTRQSAHKPKPKINNEKSKSTSDIIRKLRQTTFAIWICHQHKKVVLGYAYSVGMKTIKYSINQLTKRSIDRPRMKSTVLISVHPLFYPT